MPGRDAMVAHLLIYLALALVMLVLLLSLWLWRSARQSVAGEQWGHIWKVLVAIKKQVRVRQTSL